MWGMKWREDTKMVGSFLAYMFDGWWCYLLKWKDWWVGWSVLNKEVFFDHVDFKACVRHAGGVVQ